MQPVHMSSGPTSKPVAFLLQLLKLLTNFREIWQAARSVCFAMRFKNYLLLTYLRLRALPCNVMRDKIVTR